MSDVSTTTPLGSAVRLGQTLEQLGATIDQKVSGDPGTSYTAQLYRDGLVRCAKKIAEEGAELALALAAETEEAACGEAADLIYHILVGLRAKGVSLDDVAETLAARQGLSGLEEKARRTEET